MNNQRGGILSKLLVVPAGVALMVGFFSLGYYVGKYHGKTSANSEAAAPPLPEIESRDTRTQEEFTFYKTLSEKGNKTVSIDLKHAQARGEDRGGHKEAAAESPKTAAAQPPQPQKEKTEAVAEKGAAPNEARGENPRPSAKKEPVPSNAKLRYTVQVASYPEKGLAEDKVKELKRLGYAAFVASSELPGKGMWHRVRLGSFANRAAAERLQQDLRAKKSIPSIIVIE